MIQTREEYKKILNGGFLGKEKCPFCVDGILFDKDMIIGETQFWWIMKNKFPYTGNEKHLLVVPKIHKILSQEITSEEWGDFVNVHAFMQNFFKNESYFSFTRETFSVGNDRSVEHWHMHFVPGNIQGKFLRKMLELQGFPIKQELKI